MFLRIFPCYPNTLFRNSLIRRFIKHICFNFRRIFSENSTFQLTFVSIVDFPCGFLRNKISFLKRNTPFKKSCRRIFMGWQPVFITTKCPFGIDFSSSTVIKGRSIIYIVRLELPFSPEVFDTVPLRTV